MHKRECGLIKALRSFPVDLMVVALLKCKYNVIIPNNSSWSFVFLLISGSMAAFAWIQVYNISHLMSEHKTFAQKEQYELKIDHVGS